MKHTWRRHHGPLVQRPMHRAQLVCARWSASGGRWRALTAGPAGVVLGRAQQREVPFSRSITRSPLARGGPTKAPRASWRDITSETTAAMLMSGPVPDVGPDRESHPAAHVDLGSDTGAGRRARLALRRWCAYLQADPARCDVVLLLGSELATNAVVHGLGPAQLIVTAGPETLHIAVHDFSPVPPRPRAALLSATGGRGMHLIAQLATAWGVHVESDGKTVWCAVALYAPSGHAPSGAKDLPA